GPDSAGTVIVCPCVDGGSAATDASPKYRPGGTGNPVYRAGISPAGFGPGGGGPGSGSQPLLFQSSPFPPARDLLSATASIGPHEACQASVGHYQPQYPGDCLSLRLPSVSHLQPHLSPELRLFSAGVSLAKE